MTRSIVLIGISTFLVLFSLNRNMRLDVPSALVRRAPRVEAPRSLLALAGPLAGTVQLGQSLHLAGCEVETHLVADLLARGDRASDRSRPPLNLVLVLDRSGSMRAERKLTEALHAAREVVRSLEPDDVAALITYSTDAQVRAQAARVGDGSALLREIAAIRGGGSTNISEGLELAVVEARRYLSPDRITRILLLSDGKANHGLTERGELRSLADRIHASGISISSMGMGTTYDEEIMQDLARAGGGNYYFVEDPAEVREIFRSELAGLQRTLIREAVLEVVPAVGVALRPTEGYPATVRPDGVLEVRLGEFAAGQRRKALVAVTAAAREDGVLDPLARVVLRYRSREPEGWRTHREGGVLEVAFRTDEAEVDASRNGRALALVEEDRASRAIERAVGELRNGRLEVAVRELEEFRTRATARNLALYRDEALGDRLDQIRDLLRELPRAATDRDAAEIWVKRSRQRAFDMGR